MIKTTITLLLLIGLFFTHPHTASAAGYGISLNPPLLRVNIKPGKSISQVFTVTNLTSTDKYMVARIVPFTEADSNGNPTIDVRQSATWVSYFSLANSEIKLGTPFTIKANSSEQLILSLTIPENALLKDLYATLLISTYANVDNLDYQGSQVSATIGSNLIITVNSEINPPTILKVSQLVPTSGAFLKIGSLYFADNITPLTFSATVRNDGDFAAETKGIFRIASRGDKPVFLDGLLPVNVLSKTERVLNSSGGDDLVYNPELTQIGLHRASIQIRTDNGSADLAIDIILFPFKLLFGLIIALTILTSVLKLNPKNRGFIDTPEE